MSLLALRAVSVGYGTRTVLSDIDLLLEPQTVLCLLGANGCGKTTLLKTILGLIPSTSGEIRIESRPQADWSRTALARRIGYVPQAHHGVFPFTVEQVVLMGRTAHLPWHATPHPADIDIARHSLELLGIDHLHHRNYMHLSGGERQLVMIARALAQEPALLVMDEPTSSLDFGNQIRVLEHIDQLRTQGLSILLTTHQPEQAARLADRLVLLHQGRILAQGMPGDVLTPAHLARIYGLTEHTVTAHLPHLFPSAPADARHREAP